jgi:hypothetical protein
MAGGFPDEFQVMDLISRKEWEQLKLVKNLFKILLYFINLIEISINLII